MKCQLMIGVTFVACGLLADVPTVSDVAMVQDADSREVTITYKLSADAVVTLDVQTNGAGNAWSSIGGDGIWNAQGEVWRKVASADATATHTITWRPDLSWPDHKIAEGGARAVVTAWALDNTPDYMVVHLDVTNAPPSYYPAASFLPKASYDATGAAVTNNPAYKTTKILMRKIMASGVRWTMGSTTAETIMREAAREKTHLVTLTNNYYLGVFEVTQDQWYRVKGTYPSNFNNVMARSMRPVEKVSWNDICGTGGFLATLNAACTGFAFNLPGEAQWEFAARAGNGDTKWGDGSTIQNNNTRDDNLDKLGRYERNGGKVQNGSSYSDPAAGCDASNGTAVVGSYLPNNWGIYDMHGNVWEWCLDLYTDDITDLNGAVNTTRGTNRVRRGGGWNYAPGGCRPAYRLNGSAGTQNYTIGFRIACTAGLH